MKKIITESAYDDDISVRPEYFVARYEYDSNDEMDKDWHHRGWGKTEEEAEYNLLLQRSKQVKKPENKSDVRKLIDEISYSIFFIMLIYLIIKDFGTIASLELLIIGLSSIVLIAHLKKEPEEDEEDEEY
jgi:hypothetical protein